MDSRTIRRGELSGQSLLDALASEMSEGRRPNLLAVGSAPLEQAALRILRQTSPMDELRAVVPSVVRDADLPDDGWELRER